MTGNINVHAFYVEGATAASYRIGDSIANISQLRASLQCHAALKFDRELLQPPEIHPDPNSVLLTTNIHGTAMLEDNLMTLETTMTQTLDLEGLLLEEKKIRMEEKEHSGNEMIAMLTRIKEIEDEHIAATGWVSGVDTNLMDHILLCHLLDLMQAKLATMSGLPKCKNILHCPA
ncbi:uncharacterized protein BJ212DRAFT_1297316 [Suillus subaureus]|uniref:Uncharacterized protein n=1 Tax=Suillus subaureus TaxID=48587 RepID=A0A9P7EIU7_9AGAM|nr:uncharacterized protein BJ212DRAFT_1297316 [Suillus subaureus]KAG1822077.1 hypothetical protein BJ212DRAFT_1297316 [Suillus subaureus]